MVRDFKLFCSGWRESFFFFRLEKSEPRAWANRMNKNVRMHEASKETTEWNDNTWSTRIQMQK